MGLENTNGWDEWGKHVLLELSRLNDNYECLDKKVQTLREDIAGLKVKSGIWGIVGGMFSVILGFGIWLLKR